MFGYGDRRDVMWCAICGALWPSRMLGLVLEDFCTCGAKREEGARPREEAGVDFDGCVIHETEKAILLGDGTWIPKSQVYFRGEKHVRVTRWFARKIEEEERQKQRQGNLYEEP